MKVEASGLSQNPFLIDDVRPWVRDSMWPRTSISLIQWRYLGNGVAHTKVAERFEPSCSLGRLAKIRSVMSRSSQWSNPRRDLGYWNTLPPPPLFRLTLGLSFPFLSALCQPSLRPPAREVLGITLKSRPDMADRTIRRRRMTNRIG